ncbi:MAG TPA: hypothetical protein VF747_11415, partial [Blastocatellia bacterium]
MRFNSIRLLRRSGAAAITLSLCVSIQITALAQVIRPAQAAPRVGVNESQPLALTLFDAVKMALSNNSELEVERINVQQSEYDLFAARGARDVGVGA